MASAAVDHEPSVEKVVHSKEVNDLVDWGCGQASQVYIAVHKVALGAHRISHGVDELRSRIVIPTSEREIAPTT